MTECFLSHDCQPSDISEKVIMKILAQFGEDDDYNGVDEDEIELQQQQLKDIHSKIDQERFNRKIGRNGESQQQLQILQQISNINNNINVNIQTSKDLIDNLPVRIIHPMNLLDRKGRAHIINQGCQLFLMRYLMHKKANLTVLLFLITLRKKGESINSRIMNANYNNRKTSNERDTESRDAQIQVMVNPQQSQPIPNIQERYRLFIDPITTDSLNYYIPLGETQIAEENPNPFRRILAYTSAHFISRNIAIQQQAASLAVLLYKAHPKTTIVHLKRVFIPANVLLQLKQEISQVRSQLGIDVCEQEVEREIWEEDQKEQEMRGLYQDEGNADEDDDDNDDDIQWSHEGRMDRLRDICLDWKAL
ncbi:MAG: hypothetical protein EZS28_014988 [Streblomastix strix]|uniref:Uncharacterized protein n=1 Tax=Streblomastix strix TaxID=222440 RepID=A0A5J4W3X8_9EUKA|nr:MAG: hypothetical protein EZS28_014988 [Streblomastix strix]